jgi:hypothetical protein
MGNGNHLLFVDSTLARPHAPMETHRAGRVDEYTVKIEENSGAAESGHFLFLTQSRLAEE